MDEFNDKNRLYINGSAGPKYTVNRNYTRKNRPPVLVVLLMALIAFGAGGGGAYLVINSMLPPYADEAASASTSTPAEVVNLASGGADNEVTAVAEKAGLSVVEVTTESLVTNRFVGQAVTEGGGSGVIFSEDGYIITNNHVVSGANNLKVTLGDGSEYLARLIGTDAKSDLALIKIDANGLVPAEFADSGQIQVGELAVAIGNPLGQLGGTVTDGIVSATARDITISGENMTLIQTSAAVNPGNSGGGLFDSNGRLIGVVNAKLSGSEVEGLAFAIPSNTVINIINEIMANGYVSGRTELGLYVVEVAGQASSSAYGLPEGVYVAYDENSIGLKSGDKIVSLDGNSIARLNDIDALLNSSSPGDSMGLVVERNGQQMSGELTLAEQSQDAQQNTGDGDVVRV